MGAVTFVDGTTAGVKTIEATPNPSLKILKVTIPVTFRWSVDILSIDITKYGASKLIGWWAFSESTAGSIVITATGTTTNTAGVVAYTSTGSTDQSKTGSVVLLVE